MVVFVTAHVNTKGCNSSLAKFVDYQKEMVGLIFRDYQNIVSLIYYKRLNTTVLKSETISEMFILFLQTKRYNVLVFLNVNVTLIYVATWRNEKKVNKKSNISAISYYIE